MKESALSVMPGVSDAPSLNPNLAGQIRNSRRSGLTASEYAEGILAGNRLILSKAITLVESNRADHHDLAQEILGRLLPHTGRSVRIGITGVPGVGKSTFIEGFGEYVANEQHKNIAVLAIDPTSQRTQGSILGDKTRMEALSRNERAYIRPSPAGGSLGGVARKTRETIFLCEAAGFDVILVETVGVGQSETAVHSMVDFFLLLMLAGAGDELQGIKRGIMEMADLIAINKADGDNFHKAGSAKAEYEAALHLFPPTRSGWKPKVVTCSGLEGKGIDQVWNQILEYSQLTQGNGFLDANRREQALYWFREFLDEAIRTEFFSKPGRREKAQEIEGKITRGEMTSLAGIQELLKK